MFEIIMRKSALKIGMILQKSEWLASLVMQNYQFTGFPYRKSNSYALAIGNYNALAIGNSNTIAIGNSNALADWITIEIGNILSQTSHHFSLAAKLLYTADSRWL